MKMLEIAALPNGAHRNQTFNGTLPDGWAIIPDDMELPESFPFVDVTVEAVTHYREEYIEQEFETERQPYEVMTVTSMTAGVMPAPAPVSDPEPTASEDMDAMLVDHEYRITLLELGITE